MVAYNDDVSVESKNGLCKTGSRMITYPFGHIFSGRQWRMSDYNSDGSTNGRDIIVLLIVCSLNGYAHI